MNLDKFPREYLTFGPSPVHPLERLTARMGDARLWVKRDDVNKRTAALKAWGVEGVSSYAPMWGHKAPHPRSVPSLRHPRRRTRPRARRPRLRPPRHPGRADARGDPHSRRLEGMIYAGLFR